MARHATGHDIIVVGGSAGAFEVVRELVRRLPADLPAAVFVVLHGSSSRLVHLLSAVSKLKTVQCQSGLAITPGHVYVAERDRHMLLHEGHLLSRRGPRENLSRPAIDPLFRTAAASFGGRVIGVVLSGALNDGTAGLNAIKRMDGLTVVQDPVTAVSASMPASALRHVAVDCIAAPSELADLLAALVHQPAPAMKQVPVDIRLEAAIAAQELADMETEDRLGTPSRFTCPDCHGALWEIEDEGLLRYRCHVGHAFTADAVLAGQQHEIGTLLDNLFRSHRERAALARRMAERSRARQDGKLADDLAVRAQEYEDDAELVRRLLSAAQSPAETQEN